MRASHIAVTACLLLIICLAACLAGCGADPGLSGGTGEQEHIQNGDGTGKPGSSLLSGDGEAESGAGNPGKSGAGKGSLDGTWYEQSADGGTLEIKGSKMTYKSGFGFDSTTRFKKKGLGNTIELKTDEDFFYIDAMYIRDEDKITMRTLPHTDGDGGYHLITFLRSEYTAPPKPVYGKRHDESDPDAPKSVSDPSITSLSLTLYEPHTDYGDMAPEPPVEGEYSYELSVSYGNDGRSGILSSGFCRDVTVTDEQISGIEALLEEAGLISLNGYHILTDDMPAYEGYVDLKVTFRSGETLSLCANGEDIPAAWADARRRIHRALFSIFTDAGYNPWTEEFHSTEPMLRLAAPDGIAADYDVEYELVRMTVEGKAYDYTVYSEYPKFTGRNCPELMKTLGKITEHYRKLSAENIEADDKEMSQVPKSVWKKNDRRTSYSFYAAEQRTCEPKVFTFLLSEGHANCFGLGKYGWGKYSNFRVQIDPVSGRILSVSDYFKDTEKLADHIIAVLLDNFGSEEIRAVFASEKYREELMQKLTIPAYEGGIGVIFDSDGITLTLPYGGAQRDPEYPTFTEQFYYDEMQELMSDTYAYVW